jgi:hypothetical protein
MLIFQFSSKVEHTSMQHLRRSQKLTNRKKMLKSCEERQCCYLLFVLYFKVSALGSGGRRFKSRQTFLPLSLRTTVHSNHICGLSFKFKKTCFKKRSFPNRLKGIFPWSVEYFTISSLFSGFVFL